MLTWLPQLVCSVLGGEGRLGELHMCDDTEHCHVKHQEGSEVVAKWVKTLVDATWTDRK